MHLPGVLPPGLGWFPSHEFGGKHSSPSLSPGGTGAQGLPAQNQGMATDSERLREKKEEGGKKKRHFKKDKAPNKKPQGDPGTAAGLRLGDAHAEASQHLPFICMGIQTLKGQFIKMKPRGETSGRSEEAAAGITNPVPRIQPPCPEHSQEPPARAQQHRLGVTGVV